MATAQTNPDLLYQPDEQPPHLAAVGLGFQSVMGRLAAMAATASIIAAAGGQSDSYLSWIFFSALVVCGLGTSLQIYRIWRFGSGYALSINSGTAFIAICTNALLVGGPAMLSSLIVVSAVIQFFLISRLSLLRRILTPVVAGTVLMLLAATNLTVVMGRLSDVPEGASLGSAPMVAGVTLLALLSLRLFATAKLQQWAPIIAILLGVALAVPLGLYDLSNMAAAAWVGIPEYTWAGFDLSFSASFWALLPGFVIVNLALAVNSTSDSVIIQRIAWRRPRATDFRMVQGGHFLGVLTNLLAAVVGTLPNNIGAGSSARVVLTGVAARRVGLYGGAVLIAVAFSPKLVALLIAIPRPALVAYMLFTLSLLFVQGMSAVTREGLNGRRASVVGLSLWIGLGIQNDLIFPDLLTGTLGTFFGSGMTMGALSILLLNMLMEGTSSRSKRLKVPMGPSALPQIDAFLQEFATQTGWNDESTDRLRAVGEETVSSLLPQDGDLGASDRRSLTLSVRRSDDKLELEFMTTSDEENLEDRLAYLSDQPEIGVEREVSYRLLQHYASSVKHRKYHNIDIVTVEVQGSR